MKKTALLAAVAAMFAATPAMAGGYVGAVYGNTDLGGSSDGETWQGEGAFGASSGSWGFQLEGSLGSLEGDADTYAYGGHVYWQGGTDWRLGGVLQGSNLDTGSSEIDELVYGVEGSANIGPNTVLGASATLGSIDFLGLDGDTWNVDANIAFYPSSNFRIGGTLGTGNIDLGVGDLDSTTAGLDAEYMFSSVPISLTAGYLHFDADTLDSDTLSVGLRWNFGGGSLRDRDNATPFNVRTPLYGRVIDIR